MTHWVGLTGGIGSGKSTVANFFSDLGVRIIDADAISRQLTAKNGLALPDIVRVFGQEAVFEGVLNREVMRQLIFTDAQAKERLEAILHPLIVAQIRAAQDAIDEAYAIVDVPLLTELPMFQTLVERVLVVDCDEQLQIQRVEQRSGLSSVQIKAIMAQQATRAERLALADDVIINDDTVQSLQHKVLQQHQRYQQLFK